MRVLKGGSAETSSNKWFKFDVELDEGDLQAIVMQYGLDYDKLSVVQKYRMLSKQAEVLVTVEMEQAGLVGKVSSGSMVTSFKDFIATLPKVDS